MLSRCAESGVLVINPIVYAEVSIGFERVEELDEALPWDSFRRDPLPWEAAFLAGKCYLEYRRRGGARRSPLPDFYIGAHAAVAGMALLTRDAGRYRSYFPRLLLIAPPETERELE
jgi:predicted nucleic acid-binding protein